jgi:uncharacterized phage protein (TIGR01671 family)
MRKIKFRALKKGTNKFIYGIPTYDLLYLFDDSNLDSPDNYEIDKETLGQFLGIPDRDGVEIYEGDIINIPYNYIGDVIVKYEDLKAIYNISNYNLNRVAVIGNIHQSK